MKVNRKQWILIQRYITGHANQEERQELEAWMSESNANRQLVQEVKEVWNHTPSENFEVDIQNAWEKFQYRNLEKKEIVSPAIGYTRRKSNAPVYLLRVAAVFLVVLLAGLFVQSHLNTQEQTVSEQASAFNVLQELETENAEKVRITFSDGTRVTLNAASSIRFPKAFYGSTREVYLEGEAYFEVAHNPDQPFIVHSQDARIEVLGTEFNVRGWSEDTNVEVVVQGGKVSVQSEDLEVDERSEVILTSGFKTYLERGENPVAPQKIDVIRQLLWTSGGMHFENEDFHRVVRDLERRFNIQVTVSDSSLLEIPYTGTFQYAELDEVLSVIAASMEIGYRRDGTKVEFY